MCATTISMAYLDYNASTPLDPRVLEEMIPSLTKQFGNPASVHDSGRVAANMVETSRDRIAKSLRCNSHEVIFTSGATESNNMVMFGLRNEPSYEQMVLVGATEHKSVLGACKHLVEDGIKVTTIPVTSDGIIDLSKFVDMMNKNVDLVSVMAANSETGVIQPIDEIAKIVHEYDALLHCDAVQAIGKIPFDVSKLDVDILSMSSHKIYGPKGCGALVVTNKARKKLTSMIHGGGQENNMRSGTLNVPGIVGLGKACEIAACEGLEDATRQKSLRDRFEKNIMSSIEDITVNGGNADRLPNTSNIRAAGAIADAVLVNANAIEASTGSACTSSSIEPSHVLTAMGLDRTAADESIRISIGRPTTVQDIELAVSNLVNAIEFVRKKETQIHGRMV